MHKEIIQLLNEKRLKEAFTQIKEAAGTLNNWELKSQIETQQTTYEYMLQYMAMGTQDPQREAIYNQLLCKGYELADKTYFLKEWNKAYGYFADTFRKFAQTPPHSFKELDFMLEAAKRTFDMSQVNKEEAQRIHSYTLHEHTIDELFNKIWDMESIGDIATVTVHIKKIREKIEFDTIHGCQRQSCNDKCRHPQPAPAF